MQIVTSVSKWMQQRARIVGAVGAGLIVGAAGSAIVAASIPGPTSVIKGCYKANGNLRVIDSAATCPGGQTALNWNKTGPAGPAGAPGTAGPNGLVSNLVGGTFGPSAGLAYHDLGGLDMHNSTFGGDLRGTKFVGANVTGVIFATAGLIDADLHGVNLSGSQIRVSTTVTGSNFSGANFTGAIFEGSGEFFPPTNLTGASFQNANFTGASFVPFQGKPAENRFNGGDFSNAQFVNASMDGMLFEGGTVFTGATWTNTICPDGTNSNSHSNTCIGHLVP